MITITLNPAIDVSYHLEHFELGKGHRVENGHKTAGGKGLNVSRVLQILGEQPICSGFLGGSNGEWIRKQLDEQEMEERFVEVQGETRTCLAILGTAEQTQTELLEKGPTIQADEMSMFLSKFTEEIQDVDYVIASGSLPAGLPNDFYSTLAKIAKQENVRFLLDTSGVALEKGIEGKPFLIKPNVDELCAYVDQPSLTQEEMIQVAKEICAIGVEYVLISLGADGALLINEQKVLKATIPSLQVVNPVGSGDSMLAGITYALKQGYTREEALGWACACGTANALEAQTGFVQIEKVNDIFKQIHITVI